MPSGDNSDGGREESILTTEKSVIGEKNQKNESPQIVLSVVPKIEKAKSSTEKGTQFELEFSEVDVLLTPKLMSTNNMFVQTDLKYQQRSVVNFGVQTSSLQKVKEERKKCLQKSCQTKKIKKVRIHINSQTRTTELRNKLSQTRRRIYVSMKSQTLKMKKYRKLEKVLSSSHTQTKRRIFLNQSMQTLTLKSLKPAKTIDFSVQTDIIDHKQKGVEKGTQMRMKTNFKKTQVNFKQSFSSLKIFDTLSNWLNEIGSFDEKMDVNHQNSMIMNFSLILSLPPYVERFFKVMRKAVNVLQMILVKNEDNVDDFIDCINDKCFVNLILHFRTCRYNEVESDFMSFENMVLKYPQLLNINLMFLRKENVEFLNWSIKNKRYKFCLYVLKKKGMITNDLVSEIAKKFFETCQAKGIIQKQFLDSFLKFTKFILHKVKVIYGSKTFNVEDFMFEFGKRNLLCMKKKKCQLSSKYHRLLESLKKFVFFLQRNYKNIAEENVKENILIPVDIFISHSSCLHCHNDYNDWVVYHTLINSSKSFYLLALFTKGEESKRAFKILFDFVKCKQVSERNGSLVIGLLLLQCELKSFEELFYFGNESFRFILSCLNKLSDWIMSLNKKILLCDLYVQILMKCKGHIPKENFLEDKTLLSILQTFNHYLKNSEMNGLVVKLLKDFFKWVKYLRNVKLKDEGENILKELLKFMFFDYFVREDDVDIEGFCELMNLLITNVYVHNDDKLTNSLFLRLCELILLQERFLVANTCSLIKSIPVTIPKFTQVLKIVKKYPRNEFLLDMSLYAVLFAEKRLVLYQWKNKSKEMVYLKSYFVELMKKFGKKKSIVTFVEELKKSESKQTILSDVLDMLVSVSKESRSKIMKKNGNCIDLIIIQTIEEIEDLIKENKYRIIESEGNCKLVINTLMKSFQMILERNDISIERKSKIFTNHVRLLKISNMKDKNRTRRLCVKEIIDVVLSSFPFVSNGEMILHVKEMVEKEGIEFRITHKNFKHFILLFKHSKENVDNAFSLFELFLDRQNDLMKLFLEKDFNTFVEILKGGGVELVGKLLIHIITSFTSFESTLNRLISTNNHVVLDLVDVYNHTTSKFIRGYVRRLVFQLLSMVMKRKLKDLKELGLNTRLFCIFLSCTPIKKDFDAFVLNFTKVMNTIKVNIITLEYFNSHLRDIKKCDSIKDAIEKVNLLNEMQKNLFKNKMDFECVLLLFMEGLVHMALFLLFHDKNTFSALDIMSVALKLDKSEILNRLMKHKMVTTTNRTKKLMKHLNKNVVINEIVFKYFVDFISSRSNHKRGKRITVLEVRMYSKFFNSLKHKKVEISKRLLEIIRNYDSSLSFFQRKIKNEIQQSNLNNQNAFFRVLKSVKDSLLWNWKDTKELNETYEDTLMIMEFIYTIQMKLSEEDFFSFNFFTSNDLKVCLNWINSIISKLIPQEKQEEELFKFNKKNDSRLLNMTMLFLQSLVTKNSTKQFLMVEDFYNKKISERFLEKKKIIEDLCSKKDNFFSKLFQGTGVVLFNMQIKSVVFYHHLEKTFKDDKREVFVIHRDKLLQSSFKEFMKRKKSAFFNIFRVQFKGENTIDIFGVRREFTTLLSEELGNCKLFMKTENNQYYPNCNSKTVRRNHLKYFKFIGRFLAKCLIEKLNTSLKFCRFMYKKLLNKKLNYRDIEEMDTLLFKNKIKWILNNDIDNDLFSLSFSIEDEKNKKIVELKPNGMNIRVKNSNKIEFLNLFVEYKLTKEIELQFNCLIDGFTDLISLHSLRIFNEDELELLLCGKDDINLKEMRKEMALKNGYSFDSQSIKDFFSIIEEYDPNQRRKFLQFVTGSNRLPMNGFKGMKPKFTIQKVEKKKYPSASTCFNLLKLPDYKDRNLLKARFDIILKTSVVGFAFS